MFWYFCVIRLLNEITYSTVSSTVCAFPALRYSIHFLYISNVNNFRRKRIHTKSQDIQKRFRSWMVWDVLVRKKKRAFIKLCIFVLERQPPMRHGFLIHEIPRSHTKTYHSRKDSYGRVISPSQSPLPDNTQHLQKTDFHVPRRHSNPQYQKPSGRRPTSYTARPLGPNIKRYYSL